jgi:RNA polymerase sigma factor (sigma-70 family)
VTPETARSATSAVLSLDATSRVLLLGQGGRMKRIGTGSDRRSLAAPIPRFEDAYPHICRAASVRLAGVANLSKSDRQDLEQETLTAVWRALRHYDASRSSLRTFVEKVVSTRLASLFRRRRRQLHFELIDEHHLIGLDGIPTAEFRIDFQRIVAFLSTRDGRLAALLADHSPSEASRALGISRSTVYEGMRRIRSAFEHAGYGVPQGR